jgi:hypothetical protein
MPALSPRRLAAAFALAAVAALCWRPFVLGFLTDDWTVLVEPTVWSAAFSAERWQSLEIAQNRPMLRVVLFTLTSIVPPLTVPWHVVGALLNLAAAVAIGLCARDLLRAAGAGREESALAGAVSGACWLVLPFSAATAYWTTGTTAMPAVIAFAVSTSLLVRHWDGPVSRLRLGALVSLVGYLVYEAFFFQFALVIGFLVLARGWTGAPARAAVIAYAGAQVAAIAFSRAMRMMGAEGSRGVNANFVDTFLHWYLYVARALGFGRFAVYAALAAGSVILAVLLLVIFRRRAPRLGIAWAGAFALAIIGAGAVLITLPLALVEGALPIAAGLILAGIALRRAAPPPAIVPLALLVIAGIAAGALPFALGNYVVFALGFGARATLGSSVWIAAALGLIAALAWRNVAARRSVALAILLVWGGLFASHLMRGLEWGRAARLLATVFVDPPQLDVAALEPDAHFVLVAPELPGWVPVIEVNHHMPTIARLALLPQADTPGKVAVLRAWDRRWVVSRTLVWDTRWDGSRLVQRECRSGAVITDVPAPKLWLWNHAQRTIAPVAPGFQSGCRATQ